MPARLKATDTLLKERLYESSGIYPPSPENPPAPLESIQRPLNPIHGKLLYGGGRVN